MSKGLEALEKIDHTVCLAFNENNNALFNKDEYEHIDCKDIDEFVDCYGIIEKELKDFEWLKSKVSIEWFGKLSSDDKIRFMEIMGWKL